MRVLMTSVQFRANGTAVAATIAALISFTGLLDTMITAASQKIARLPFPIATNGSRARDLRRLLVLLLSGHSNPDV